MTLWVLFIEHSNTNFSRAKVRASFNCQVNITYNYLVENAQGETTYIWLNCERDCLLLLLHYIFIIFNFFQTKYFGHILLLSPTRDRSSYPTNFWFFLSQRNTQGGVDFIFLTIVKIRFVVVGRPSPMWVAPFPRQRIRKIELSTASNHVRVHIFTSFRSWQWMWLAVSISCHC